MTLFWEDLGTDDGGLPTHLPMGVNVDGQGPEDDSKAHHYECWCTDPDCPLTRALVLAWASGTRGLPLVKYLTVREAASRLGVHENTIRNWCDNGVIRNVERLPGSSFRRVLESEVERLREIKGAGREPHHG